MTNNQNRLEILLEKFSQNDVSEGEFNELCELIAASEDQTQIKGRLANDLQQAPPSPLDKKKMDKMLRKVLHPESAPVYEMNKRKVFGWTRIAAAAVIILMIGSGVYWFANKSHNQSLATTGKLIIKTDIKPPASNNAVITLANGKQIVLDSAGNGSLAMQDNVNLVKLADGQIVYSGTSNEIEFNTLTNPRGSKVINITLADGSKVWLNAESSLRYPTAFAGKERSVDLTGEGYFEVAKNESMPFKVSVNDMTVEVLGTHFNINSYADEAGMKTTLLEGAVKVTKGNAVQKLSPGQQAQVNTNGQISLNKGMDLEEVMAWKNGKFIFTGNNIGSVMRQLEKWYDISIEYKGDVTKDEFVGIISRNVSISQILKMLEKTNSVSFEIKDRKVIVK